MDVLWSLMARSAATEVVRGRRAALLRAAIELRRRRSDADIFLLFVICYLFFGELFGVSCLVS